jgi:hypothetical protein
LNFHRRAADSPNALAQMGNFFLAVALAPRDFFSIDFRHFHSKFGRICTRISHAGDCSNCSTTLPAPYDHLFTHKSPRENFSFVLCERRRETRKENRVFRSRPLRAASSLQRQSLIHAVLIAFPTFERGKTKNSSTLMKFLISYARESRKKLKLNTILIRPCSYTLFGGVGVPACLD